MNTRSALAVALLAAGFAYQPANRAPSSRAKESTQKPAASSDTVTYDKELKPEDWPRVKLHEFFTNSEKAKDEGKGETKCSLVPQHTTVSFLLATVPDPQNSHYPVMFDRFMESIRRASS